MHASIFGRFFQMGYVTRNIDAASQALISRTGADQIDLIYDMRDSAGKQVELKNLSHFHLPGLEIELIEPRLDRPSLYLDALPDEAADMAFHHAGFLIPNDPAWAAAVASFERFGTPVLMAGEVPGVVRFAYVDTRRETGHYSEIVQRFTTVGRASFPDLPALSGVLQWRSRL